MKNLIVFGASGGTGKQVVEQALQAGFTVTALVRRPEVFGFQHPQLRLVKGDVLQPASFAALLQGQDAIISCLGIPKVEPTTLYSVGMKNIIAAMQACGLTRIICISSGAISTPPGSSWIMSFLLKQVLQRIYKPVYSDMALMEAALQHSSLNWTIIGAPKLTNGPKTGQYRNITRRPLRSIPTISRADLAHFMIRSLEDIPTFRSRLEIAY